MLVPNLLVVPAAPALSGLTFRHITSIADYAAMAAIHAGSQQHDHIDPHSSRESVPDEAQLRGMFPQENMIGNPDLVLALLNERVIGYNHVVWRWTEVTGVRVYLHLGYLLPAWRGHGVGSALLHWAQQRIRALAAVEHADARATFATNVSSTEREADALICHAGYTDVRRLSDMLLSPIPVLVLPALPPGVSVIRVEPAHYRAIYHTMKDAYREIWTSTPESEDDYQAFLAENVTTPRFDPTLWQVAWAGEEVAGVVISRIVGQVGHIAEVEVRRSWQRRGIARVLLQRAIVCLGERGMTEVRLYTDAANGQGARSLYESLGFREVKQHIFYRKLLDGAAI